MTFLSSAPGNQIRRIIFAACAFGFSLGILACGPDSKRSEVYHGQELIETRSYGEAIAFLEDQLKLQPDNPELQVLLASAYAARAGIQMTSYVDLLKQIRASTGRMDHYDNEPLSKALTAWSLESKDADQKQAFEILNKIYLGAYQIQEFLLTVRILPSARNPAQYEDLQRALAVLENGKYLAGGQILYRALLRLSRLKYLVRVEFEWSVASICPDNANRFVEQAHQVRDELDLVFRDLELGLVLKKDKASIRKLGEKVQTQLQNALAEYEPIKNSIVFENLTPCRK